MIGIEQKLIGQNGARTTPLEQKTKRNQMGQEEEALRRGVQGGRAYQSRIMMSN